MSKGMNYGRPRFRTQGRLSESVSGADIPAEVRGVPRPRPSKASLRELADQAAREFAAKQRPSHQKPLIKPVGIVPPLGDDEDALF